MRSRLSPQSTSRHGGSRHRRALIAAAIAVASVMLAGCFSQGIYLVGTPMSSTQMAPGLWRSFGGSDCTWQRVDRDSNAVVGRNVRTNGPQYVQLEPSDLGIAIGNCLPFWQEPGAFARPAAQPGNPFGDGDFLVGYEVMPATYVANPPPGSLCSWAIVKGFHGKNASGGNPDFVRGATTGASVTAAVIRPGDYGFTSQGCGQWQPSTPAPASGLKIEGVVQDFPDPFVLPVDDPTACDGAPSCYYAYATQSGFLGLTITPVIMSTDLVNWQWAGYSDTGTRGRDAMANPPNEFFSPWARYGYNWAPSVIHLPDNDPDAQYVMYYTARSKTSGRQCLGVATAEAPSGPFVDAGTGPLCNPSGDRIDASVYQASDHLLYVAYADMDGIRARPLVVDGPGREGIAFANDNTERLLLQASSAWEHGRIEAPDLVRSPSGTLFLLYSGSTYNQPTYAVGAAQCATPLTLCTRVPSSSPFLQSQGAMLGPGGQTAFQDPDGGWHLAFHAWDETVGYENGNIRSLHVLPMNLSGNPAIG